MRSAFAFIFYSKRSERTVHLTVSSIIYSVDNVEEPTIWLASDQSAIVRKFGGLCGCSHQKRDQNRDGKKRRKTCYVESQPNVTALAKGFDPNNHTKTSTKRGICKRF